MNRHALRLLTTSLFAAAATAHAAPITLDFEHIDTYPPSFATTYVSYFYAGGSASNGSVGQNVGALFSDGSVLRCLNSLTVTCGNASRGDSGNAASREGALQFIMFETNTINLAAGFTDSLSLQYSALGVGGAAAQIYEGLDGTGNLLATFDLPVNGVGCPLYNADFCSFTGAGVAFAGTARSVSFIHAKYSLILDDIQFGGSDATVSEPSSAALVAVGALALLVFSRRQLHRPGGATGGRLVFSAISDGTGSKQRRGVGLVSC